MKTLTPKKSGYTIMEIMVVLIIISVIAGFAIPSFTKSVVKRQRIQGLQNLGAIAASARIIAERARNFTSLCWEGATTLAEINNQCNTAILPSTITFCDDPDNTNEVHMRAPDSSGDYFICSYTGPGNFTLTLDGCALNPLDPC